MRFRSLLAGFVALIALSTPSRVEAAAFSDIPGEGNLRCQPADCPDSRGDVTSTPSGLVSGSLAGSAPEFSVSVMGSPIFLTFSGGDSPLGPLGLNPLFSPESNRDSRIPVSGQPIRLNLTNATSRVISALTFYLQIPQSPSTAFPPQSDGLSFGLWCNSTLEEPRNCVENLALLATPTGPGQLNPLDITPNGSPESPFGDLLRFTSVNLAPGGTAAVTFFITDRKATLDPSTGGSEQGASPSFNLEIVATPVPEPATLLLTGAALLGVLTRYRHVKRP